MNRPIPSHSEGAVGQERLPPEIRCYKDLVSLTLVAESLLTHISPDLDTPICRSRVLTTVLIKTRLSSLTLTYVGTPSL